MTIQIKTTKATKELLTKHNLGQTLCPIDICLRKGIITAKQHKAAQIFQHIYWMIHGGSLRLRSAYRMMLYKVDMLPAANMNSDNLQERYEKTYREIADLLDKIEAYELMCDICVHELHPLFLRIVQKDLSLNRRVYREYSLFRIALKNLEIYLSKKKFLD